MALPALIDPFTGLPKKKAVPAYPPPYTPGNSPTDAQGGYGGYTPPASTQPDSLTIPGNVPDYKSLIANDPVFVQLQRDLAAQGVGDLASRNAAINRLLTGFGQVPDVNQAAQQLGISDLGQAVDPTTGQLAAENPYSTTKRLGQTHTDALRTIRQQLAARGLLQSGELGFRLGRENNAYGQATSDANQALLDSIAQLQGQFTSAQRAASQQQNQALGEATNRQIGLNPATGSQTAHLDPATGTYVDGNGNHWNADGTPAAAPVVAPPVATAPPATQAGGTASLGNTSGGLNIGAFLAPGVASGHRLDPRYADFG